MSCFIFSLQEFEQNLKGKRTKVIHRNLVNLNGLFILEKALTSLGISQLWMNSRMNIEMVKSSFTPGALNMTVPLFIVGIQRIDYELVITHDVNCILQDPSGIILIYLTSITIYISKLSI